MRVAIGITLFLTLGTSHAQFGGPGPFDLLDYSGAELFERFCASCHGASGRGDGPVATSLNAGVPDLTGIAGRNGGEFPVARVLETIDGRSLAVPTHGTRLMPVWGYEFWVEEGADRTAETNARTLIQRLIDHLRSIQVP
jgi:hypothetical protein